jgi:hypothetical protein
LQILLHDYHHWWVDKSEATKTGEQDMMDIDLEIVLLNEQIAEVRFTSTETQLKATLLVAKAGMLQAAAIRQQTLMLDMSLSALGA